MNKITQFLRQNLYLSLTMLLLAASIAFAAVTFGTIGFSQTVDKTSVGTIYLGEYDESQYEDVLGREVLAWRQDADYVVGFQGYQMAIDLDLFAFDMQATINGIVKDEMNAARFSLSEASKLVLVSAMADTFTEGIMSEFDQDAFVSDVLADMASLDVVKTFDLSAYLDQALRNFVIDTAMISNIDPDDIAAISESVDQLEIGANSRFSLLSSLEGKNLTNNQMSIIASGIQKITANTSFSGYVFEQNYTLPLWSEEGMNVRIMLVNKYDFSFYNDLAYTFVVEVEQLAPDTLAFRLKGYPFITTYTTEAIIHDPLPFQTIYQEDTGLGPLTPGVEVTETDTEYIYDLVLQQGVDGKIVTYIRTAVSADGTTTSERLYDELYDPVNEIIAENIVEKGGA